MPRQAQQVDLQCFDVDGNFPGRLYRIGVKQYPPRMGYLNQLPDGLNGSDFIIS